MEVVPFNFGHQTAVCRMLLWFFSQKVAVGPFSMFQTVTSFQRIFGTGFKPSCSDTAKVVKPQQRAAKPKQPPAPRRRWRESISLISCCCLLLSFFPLGFKFCCIVLRVANARDLIIYNLMMDYNSGKLTRVG